MVDRKSRETFDEPPPPSSTRRRDQQALIVICGILSNRFNVPRADVRLDSRFIEDLGIGAHAPTRTGFMRLNVAASKGSFL